MMKKDNFENWTKKNWPKRRQDGTDWSKAIWEKLDIHENACGNP